MTKSDWFREWQRETAELENEGIERMVENRHQSERLFSWMATPIKSLHDDQAELSRRVETLIDRVSELDERMRAQPAGGRPAPASNATNDTKAIQALIDASTVTTSDQPASSVPVLPSAKRLRKELRYYEAKTAQVPDND